jgi:hypothetical protein
LLSIFFDEFMLTVTGIRLVQYHDGNTFDESKSFYLFSDNCSEKEDFYHAMLQAQDHHPDLADRKDHPVPLKFDTPDLVKLVQQLHASEENLHTRWINALIGRVFLGLYKTSEVKNFIATKITKKIARVPKPALISSVTLRSIDMGTLPPFLTNPKLKELTVDGELVVEADVSYKGNFRIEIAAIARIELGARFKAREVTLVLATILKRLDGHLLIRIKPPPSNRIWLTFETPPRMELSVEPIVSSRQITYGVILRAIESRIREVLNETLVLPNWDDMPFTDTLAQAIRGGIWQNDAKSKEHDIQKDHQNDIALENATIDAEKLDEKADAASSHLSISSSFHSEDSATGTSSSAEIRANTARPRPMRSSSSAAQVHLDSANASAEIIRDRESSTPTSVRSLPLNSPMRSPLRPDKAHSVAAFASTSEEDISPPSVPVGASDSPPLPTADGSHGRAKSRELTAEDIASAAAAAAAAASAGAQATKKTTFNQSLNTATAAARNWLVSKQNTQTAKKTNNTSHQRNISTDLRPTTAEGHKPDNNIPPETPPRPELHSSISKSHTEPMGRGHPLPPPGTPLPPPARAEKRQTWAIPAAASTFANIAKRKPIGTGPNQSLSEKRSREHLHTPASASLNPPSPYFADPQDHHSTEMRRSGSASATTDDMRQVPRRKSSAASSTTSIAPPPLPKSSAASSTTPIAPPPLPKSSAASSTTSIAPPPLPKSSAASSTTPIAPPPLPKSSAASSTTSIAPPPLPKRRQRQQSVNLKEQHRRQGSQISLGGDEGGGEALFVVEAPVAEASVPSTPVDAEIHENRWAGDEVSSRSGSGSASASEDRDKGHVGVVK